MWWLCAPQDPQRWGRGRNGGCSGGWRGDLEGFAPNCAVFGEGEEGKRGNCPSLAIRGRFEDCYVGAVWSSGHFGGGSACPAEHPLLLAVCSHQQPREALRKQQKLLQGIRLACGPSQEINGQEGAKGGFLGENQHPAAACSARGAAEIPQGREGGAQAGGPQPRCLRCPLALCFQVVSSLLGPGKTSVWGQKRYFLDFTLPPLLACSLGSRDRGPCLR